MSDGEFTTPVQGAWRPRRLFPWQVATPGTECRGACGVTSDQAGAIADANNCKITAG